MSFKLILLVSMVVTITATDSSDGEQDRTPDVLDAIKVLLYLSEQLNEDSDYILVLISQFEDAESASDVVDTSNHTGSFLTILGTQILQPLNNPLVQEMASSTLRGLGSNIAVINFLNNLFSNRLIADPYQPLDIFKKDGVSLLKYSKKLTQLFEKFLKLIIDNVKSMNALNVLVNDITNQTFVPSLDIKTILNGNGICTCT